MNPLALRITLHFGTLTAVLLTGAGCVSVESRHTPATPPTASSAAAAPPPTLAAKPTPPASHTLTRAPLRRKVLLDAVVEGSEMQSLRVEAKAWNDLTVLEAVPHGAWVKKGDQLVKLDTAKITDQIEDLEKDQPAAATSLEIATAELENLTGATPQKLEAARRARRIADEDLAYFENTGRSQRERSAAMNLKGAQQRLENATEELRQLEKMYKADDLTEETEEIILKRQKVDVEFAQFSLDSTRLNTDRELKTSLPREAESLKAQQRDQELALTLAEDNLPRTLARKRLEVEKLARDQRKAEKRLSDLRADLQAMDVRAPVDGIAIHGASEYGRWTTGAAVTKKLVPGGKLLPFEVFMTVVNPNRLQLIAVTPEAELGKVKPGMAGEASPVADPQRKLPVTVETCQPVPLVSGGFETVLSLPPDSTVGLLPGMNCKVTLREAPREPALLAPNEAIFTEDEEKTVYVTKAGGGHDKRTVKVGATDGRQTELLEGVAEGDKILLKKPE